MWHFYSTLQFIFYYLCINRTAIRHVAFGLCGVCQHQTYSMHTKEEKMEAFGRLLDVLDDLREKCPWDKKQTFESLRPNTIEETYELCDALAKTY